ncbi:hypothetical protein Tco_0411681 [Tanacetum coccineum]
MVQLLRQNCQFHGFKDEDANEHLDKYLSITQFIKQNGVSQDIINLNLLSDSTLTTNPTPSDPVVASLSPSLTPTGDSDSILEETDTLLPHHDSTSPEVDDDKFDPEGDILFLEGLLNDEISSDLPPLELNNDPEGDILFS